MWAQDGGGAVSQFGEIEMVSGDAGELVADDRGVVPRWPCQCGGRYCLGFNERREPSLVHTLPYCARYVAVEDTDQAVVFSRQNREAIGGNN